MQMEKIGNKIGRWHPPKHTQFQKWNTIQATPKQKSEGWDRRRHALAMMELVLKYQSMTMSDLKALEKKKDVTILELQMIRYVLDGVKDNKLLLHMMDKHISNAPVEVSWLGLPAVNILDFEI